MARTEILGHGYALPEGRLHNNELASKLGLLEDEIFAKTGIRARSIARDETLVDLAHTASLSALGTNSPKDLDFIIFATSLPAKKMPATANILQSRFENSHCLCFDMNAACTGFKYGLNLADALIASGQARKGLLVGADLASRMVDYRVGGPSLLFGDAAGALVLGSGKSDSGIIGHYDHTYSNYHDIITINNGGADTQITTSNSEAAENFMQMNGPRVFSEAVSGMASLATEVCARHNIRMDEISYIVPHQANFRIIEAVSWRLKLPLSKFVIDLEDIGNTAAASIPVAFSRAVNSGLIKKGDVLLFISFAAGFSGGATLLKY